MLKSLLIGACLTASAVACTTAPAKRTDTTAAAADRACIQDTGTRIPVRPGECTAFGRTYSGDDVQRTGATDVGQALRLLDPSITINH